MALSREEREHAVSIAKGMLIAQRSNRSMAGSLVNSQHFTSIPYPVKMEALKQYSRLENEDPYRTSVNREPDRAEMAKAVARAATREGLLSLPLSATVGLVGAMDAFPRGRTPFDTATNLDKKSVNRYVRRLLPIAGAVFVGNALVGGVREGIRQKAQIAEAKDSNEYLSRIRSTASDAEMNAMIFGTTHGKEHAYKLEETLAKLDSITTAWADAGSPVLGANYLTDPSTTYPYRKAVEIGIDMEQEYQDSRE